MKKKILISFVVFIKTYCIAMEPFLKPLWEEDAHFCYYRTLCIEGSVYTIGSLVKEARIHPENTPIILDKIEKEVFNCKNALGSPIY
jgi:hypothetical protein